MAAAEKDAADVAVVDIQTSSIATDVTSSSNNKRKRNDDVDNSQAGTAKNGNNNNKRRKKKKGGGGKKGSHQHRHNKQKRNWIESCSESIARIPSNCAAPVTCVITRSEIEEEPLLPKPIADNVAQSDDTTHTPGKEAKIDCSSNNELTASKTSSIIEQSENNIAILSKSFATTLAQERKVPWKIATTVQVNGEEKKVFIPVQRHTSANGPTKWQQKQKKQGHKKGQNYCHLPDGDNGDGKKNPYPKEAVPDKFWAQRKRLFSRYDEGIQIGGKDDPEMWYSVTPESIGLHIANRMVSMISNDWKNASVAGAGETSNTQCNESKKEIVIIDAFCGCGGNSIAFARLNNNKDVIGSNARVKVIAVDNNLSRLKMAANNASIYGICKENIVLIHADAVEVINAYQEGTRKEMQSEIALNDRCHETYFGFAVGGVELLPDHVDALFLSPPWGGLGYNMNNDNGNSGFDPVHGISLESRTHDKEDDVIKTNGGELLTMAVKAVLSESKQEGLVVAFLPRNIDGINLTRVAVTSDVKGVVELEQNVVNGKVKTVTAYLGPCVNQFLTGEGKK
ncbi:hypothetical protein ACHAWT_003026 [Skeletonema menzelii]